MLNRTVGEKLGGGGRKDFSISLPKQRRKHGGEESDREGKSGGNRGNIKERKTGNKGESPKGGAADPITPIGHKKGGTPIGKETEKENRTLGWRGRGKTHDKEKANKRKNKKGRRRRRLWKKRQGLDPRF